MFSCKAKPETPTGKTSCVSYLNTNYKVSRERKSDLANENSTWGGGGRESVVKIYELKASYTLMNVK